ncbi:Hypothetical predicted protein [Mytilus galloprovincialis]|uniref:Uncharacterized protein n=1 Tax=Mytilus galloprovincialis TaxID=29158 RepID=A0A8B6HEK1_MYTGA|nr:Hypothetical predicted protein [Mytilus galloprovincialis]
MRGNPWKIHTGTKDPGSALAMHGSHSGQYLRVGIYLVIAIFKGLARVHMDSKESTNNDLDTVDCHLRVTKKADISKLQGEEIEFENSEQSNQWIQSKNMDEITEAQQNDEVIKLILKMKSESNEKPKWEEISVQSKELKTYWSQWDQLKLIDNVLYREWISNINSEMKQLILEGGKF